MMIFHDNCTCFENLEQNRTIDKQGFTLRLTNNAVIATKYDIDLEAIALPSGISIDCELIARAIAQAEQVLFSLFTSF
jgi:hypothetical protein